MIEAQDEITFHRKQAANKRSIFSMTSVKRYFNGATPPVKRRGKGGENAFASEPRKRQEGSELNESKSKCASPNREKKITWGAHCRELATLCAVAHPGCPDLYLQVYPYVWHSDCLPGL